MMTWWLVALIQNQLSFFWFFEWFWSCPIFEEHFCIFKLSIDQRNRFRCPWSHNRLGKQDEIMSLVRRGAVVVAWGVIHFHKPRDALKIGILVSQLRSKNLKFYEIETPGHISVISSKLPAFLLGFYISKSTVDATWNHVKWPSVSTAAYMSLISQRDNFRSDWQENSGHMAQARLRACKGDLAAIWHLLNWSVLSNGMRPWNV